MLLRDLHLKKYSKECKELKLHTDYEYVDGKHMHRSVMADVVQRRSLPNNNQKKVLKQVFNDFMSSKKFK
jgi:hypothetical protein